jgi:two-component system, chemotaxis family, chemotaxis protein CheY
LGKVLVVDDSSIVRKLIVRELLNMSYTPADIIEGSDGIEAVANALKFTFDLIVIDWNMPNMTGLDAIKAIRSGGVATPIIMVTTESERSSVINAIQAGANNYLVKPFTSEDFRQKISQLLGPAPAPAANPAPQPAAAPPPSAPMAAAPTATQAPPVLAPAGNEDDDLRLMVAKENPFNKPFESYTPLDKMCARAYFGDARERFHLINLLNNFDEVKRLGKGKDAMFQVLEMFFHDSILNGVKGNKTELEAFRSYMQVGVSTPKYASVEVSGKTRFFDEFLTLEDIKNNLYRSCIMAKFEGKPTRPAFDQRIKSVMDSGVDSVIKLYGLKPVLELQQEFETKGFIQ